MRNENNFFVFLKRKKRDMNRKERTGWVGAIMRPHPLSKVQTNNLKFQTNFIPRTFRSPKVMQ